MKEKILILSNAVLGIAVVVLFVLHFSSRGSCCKSSSSAQPGVSITSIPQGSIVYINIDTLQDKYDMYAEMKKTMEEKQKKVEMDLAAKSRALEAKAQDFQEKAQKGLLLRSEMEKIQLQLMEEQQNLQKYGSEQNNALLEDNQVMNRKYVNNIMEYLKTYNKDGRFQYILSYAFGSQLLYVPDSLDITKDVLTGLNEQYAIEHKKNQK